ncbi:hypothetical protein QCA50_006329 [Cerrena zonata]|uniref:Uncharacterized protein n=1 Tax=Cerrena zonata TaxID=2478898 RepID=A0AAW0GEP1_9APHY
MSIAVIRGYFFSLMQQFEYFRGTVTDYAKILQVMALEEETSPVVHELFIEMRIVDVDGLDAV